MTFARGEKLPEYRAKNRHDGRIDGGNQSCPDVTKREPVMFQILPVRLDIKRNDTEENKYKPSRVMAKAQREPRSSCYPHSRGSCAAHLLLRDSRHSD